MGVTKLLSGDNKATDHSSLEKFIWELQTDFRTMKANKTDKNTTDF